MSLTLLSPVHLLDPLPSPLHVLFTGRAPLVSELSPLQSASLAAHLLAGYLHPQPGTEEPPTDVRRLSTDSVQGVHLTPAYLLLWLFYYSINYI